MNTAIEELLAIRQLQSPAENIDLVGQDPVFSTRLPLGETTAAVLAAIGIAVNDLWQQQTGRRQDLRVLVPQAAATLRSYNYFSVEESSAVTRGSVPTPSAASINWALQQQRQRISTPHPTRDGRYFLPHMGLPHLAQRVWHHTRAHRHRPLRKDARVAALDIVGQLEGEQIVQRPRHGATVTHGGRGHRLRPLGGG